MWELSQSNIHGTGLSCRRAGSTQRQSLTRYTLAGLSMMKCVLSSLLERWRRHGPMLGCNTLRSCQVVQYLCLLPALLVPKIFSTVLAGRHPLVHFLSYSWTVKQVWQVFYIYDLLVFPDICLCFEGLIHFIFQFLQLFHFNQQNNNLTSESIDLLWIHCGSGWLQRSCPKHVEVVEPDRV